MFSAPLHSSFAYSLKWRYGFTAILDFDQLAVMKETVAIHKPERACTARVNQATPGGLQYLLFYSSFQFVFNGRGRASTPRSDKIT
jgi:hypothetical protein